MQNALTEPPLRTPNFPVDHSDIFSTSRTPSPDSTKGQRTRFPTQEPSDIPRLRTQQNTAGYRDGIAASKSLYIQNGFDEGYSLGAVVGRKAGWILGILGGIATALRNEKDGDSVKTLEQEARKELTVEEVLGKKWWNWEAMGDEDIWKFDIGSTNPSETGVDQKDVSWQQVVDAHPLIKKWTVCITRLAEEWSVDLHRFSREDAPQPDPEEEHTARGKS